MLPAVIWISLMAIVFPAPATASVQGPRGRAAVRGAVTDTAGRPIAGAVVVRDAVRPDSSAADQAGRFVVTGLALGRHVFNVYAVGYSPSGFEVEFERDTSVDVTIPLEGRPPVLDSIGIVGDRALGVYARKLTSVGFAERRLIGERTAMGATFLTPEYIEARKPFRLSHLLDGVRSLHMRYVSNTPIPYGRDNRCVMSVWLDGQEIRNLFPRTDGGAAFQGTTGTTRENSPGLDALPVSEVAAVEVYPSAVVTPPQFQSLTGNCGAIVLWTKQ